MMLAMAGCPPLCALRNTSSSPHSQTLNLQFRRIFQPHLPFPSSRQFFGFRLVLGRERIAFCVSARKRRKNTGTLLEVDGIGDERDEWGDDEDEFIPFPNMKKWAQNKPRGFGEGKVYDTRVEDKLLEEIEQSRVAQLANINKLKNNPVGHNSGKANNLERKAPETVANAFRVRVVNLPKKKNIHRDLQLAFKVVPGIVNIIPAVSGNQKTRDPVCRGFAFVDLKTEDDANRFVHMFSKQSITFGKIQKQINCEMMDPGSPKVTYQQSAGRTYTDPLSEVPSYDGSAASEFDIDDSSLDVWEESGSGESDVPIDLEGGMASDLDLDITSLDTWQDTTNDESNALENEHQATMEWEDVRENLESLSTSEMDDNDRLEPIMESATNSLSSRQLEEIWALQKKSLGKQRKKVPKLKVQASELHDGDIADQRVGTDVDSLSSNSLENIQALERRLLARGKEWKASKSNNHAAEQNFDDIKYPKQQATAGSLVSRRVESTQGLQRGPLAREKRETVPKLNILTTELHGDHHSAEATYEPTTNPVSSKQQKKKQKKKRGKAPVVCLPGSANRLKIKEKVVLTDVFSKYGINTTKQEA